MLFVVTSTLKSKMSKKDFSTIPSTEQAKNENNGSDVALDVDSGGKYTPINRDIYIQPEILTDRYGYTTEKHVTVPEVEFEKKDKKKKMKEDKKEDGSKPVSFLQLVCICYLTFHGL